MPGSRNLKIAFIDIGMVVAVIILLFFIFEVFLRLYSPIHLAGYKGGFQYDQELGFRLKDDIHVVRTTDYQEETLTNRLGTTNFQKDFDNYEVLIFAIGDSHTMGTGLPVDSSYPFQLDLLLNIRNEHYVNKYAVVNLGTLGFGGEQNLMALKRYANKLGKPRFILYLGCSNDYLDDLQFKNGYKHMQLIAGTPYWGWYLRPLMWLAHETEIGKRIKIVIQNRWLQRISSSDEWKDGNKETSELEAPIFQELSKISQAYGAKLIVSWASFDGSYQWLKEYAGENFIAFADWHPAVKSVRQNIAALPIYNPHSGNHYRTWVNGQIARAYAQQILSAQEIQQVKPGGQGGIGGA